MNQDEESETIQLGCRCGQMRGVASGVKPGSGCHVICYCRDCREFARFLGRDSEVLDAAGGTEIYQLPPARITLTEGLDQLRCIRLTDKGLFRWYAGCCNTPIGNTGPASLPFVGVIHNFVVAPQRTTERFGPVMALAFPKQAEGQIPEQGSRLKSPIGYLMTILGKLLVWKLTRQGLPSPFFDAEGNCRCDDQILHPQ